MDWFASASHEFWKFVTYSRKRIDKGLSNPLNSLAANICNLTPLLLSKKRKIAQFIIYLMVIIFILFIYSHSTITRNNKQTDQKLNNENLAEKRQPIEEDFKMKQRSSPNDLQIPAEVLRKERRRNKIARPKLKLDFRKNARNTANVLDFGNVLNNEEICIEGKEVTLLITVASAVAHFPARKAIRKTWGSDASLAPLGVKLLFLLGRPGGEDGRTLQKQVEEESKIYEDIIQYDFLDSYLNLTIKTVMGLEWATQNCQEMQYFMKTDDDIFVNVPKLLTHLHSESESHRDFVTGCIKQKKSFAPVNLPSNLPELPPTHPAFVAGAGYVISGSLVPKLYGATQFIRLVPVEDVYVTGHLARSIGVHPPIHHSFFTCGELLHDDCDAMQMFTGHKITPERMYQIWEKVNPQDYSTSPCFDF